MNFKYFLLGFFGIILILSFSIGDAYAQTPDWLKDIEDNLLSTIAVITATSTAIGLIVSLYVTSRQIKIESDAKFLELTHTYTKELVKKFDEGFKIKDVDDDGKDRVVKDVKDECVSWAFKYVDSLDEVAYIKKKKAIPTKITDYFGPGWFGMAKSLMIWHDEVVRKDELFNKFRSAIETWPHVYEHCFKSNMKDDNGIKINDIKIVPPQEFPPILLKENLFKKINFETIENISKDKTDNFE